MKLICDCGNEMEFRKANAEDYYYDLDKFDIQVGYEEDIEITCKICKKYIETYRGESFSKWKKGEIK